jgi:asparagine synthetase B (glutamine-hydrolysing)
MFSIPGFIGLVSDARVKARVERMVSVVVHSGSSSSILLAATTLLDKTGELAISFNGKIFNYVERREELAVKDVLWHTRWDTEVILRPYQDRVRHASMRKPW